MGQGRRRGREGMAPRPERALARTAPLLLPPLLLRAYETVSALPARSMHAHSQSHTHHPPQEVTGNVDPDLRFETVGGGNLSMLVTWEGSDPALDLPVLIGCHYDVSSAGRRPAGGC